jgi:calcineurin-like phosphoesterase family protein
MTIYFISDTHFSHENIIGYAARPFASVEEMDETMVDRWNAVVKPSDHIYHLGDVAMKKPHLAIIKRLNGKKRLIMGNHDIFDYSDYIKAGFQKVMGMRVLNNILFTHVPVHPYSMGRFRGNAHGHIHQAATYDGQYINLSVEAVDYTPVTLEDVATRLDGLALRYRPVLY